ncbi:hypothetical protein P4476_04445 [Ureibacillus terrenus]|uniref:hypothetical protein n=1 Tax=Ureibacillus terrenus TaxID=118246 RepID=UPI002E24E2FA|nr:hypothetical protein [Ureibacillus terrenus]
MIKLEATGSLPVAPGSFTQHFYKIPQSADCGIFFRKQDETFRLGNTVALLSIL